MNTTYPRKPNECIFDAAEARKLLEHARSAAKHPGPYGYPEETGPGLLWVHDDGVYLMSNGLPRLTSDEHPERSVVVYAQDMNPQTDPDCWEIARQAVGGDDFVEVIAAEHLTGLNDPRVTHLVIRCYKLRFTIEYVVTTATGQIKAQL